MSSFTNWGGTNMPPGCSENDLYFNGDDVPNVCGGWKEWCGNVIGLDEVYCRHCKKLAQRHGIALMEPDTDPTDGGYYGYLSDPEEHLHDD